MSTPPGSERADRGVDGVRPITHHPVGIVTVITRHWAPAMITLPAGTSRTGAGFRGNRIRGSTPLR